jgi:transposase-like protein
MFLARSLQEGTGMETRFHPPHCPQPQCPYHVDPTGWRHKRMGFYARQCQPRRIQRYLCLHCGRSFSTQTFSTDYWLRRPDLLRPLFHRVLACSGYRQIAREFGVSPSTVQNQVARLGRHCLLFQHQLRPRLQEPAVLDGFESFEYSQYFPFHFNVLVGKDSHFFYGFTDSPLRRKGRMTEFQRRRREELERTLGRPDPGSVQKDVAELLRLCGVRQGLCELHSDDHPAYPRAFRQLPDVAVQHHVTSSLARRTTTNPLFPVNLLDLLIRHGSANHKRETIAFSKRRQSAVERLAILQVWRNFIKPFSERRGGGTPAERLGLCKSALTVAHVLAKRLFPSLLGLPERVMRYYRRFTETAAIQVNRRHRLRFAD